MTSRPNYVVALIFLTFSSLVQGVERFEIAKCASLSGDLERLICYDQIAEGNGLDKPQTTDLALSDTGDWIVKESVNPIDDSKTVVIVLTASSGQSAFGKKVSFIARCSSKETEAYISWHDYLGSKADVLTRVGKSKATARRWSLSTDSQATFSPDAKDLLMSMSETDTFIAQVTPYNDSPITAVFETQGLAEALKPLRSTCNW